MASSAIAEALGVSRERIRQILASEGLSTRGAERRWFSAKTRSPSLESMQRREYQCWWNMIDRCSNPNSPSFRNYGARGITVAARWLQFENFFADMGPRPGPGYSIERVDNLGNYTASNCRWATKAEQAANRRRSGRVRTIDLERAGKLLNSGLSGPKVAKKMGISTASVYGHWKQVGLHRWKRKLPSRKPQKD